ncbi:hypothetical protein SLH49_06915 [Cognatiyoonia sp. IB215446]|uniref:hypothetical protein n=1 Tax=Cognatiyoonia sp. IB215446 TaxID=3097355 RepID=UPI002A0C3400|nr:hypothetical protein [Cognatiyoonia sp. IB215446]MDX8347713.1 hypothetical protein [Cognatiyoonia sp. IB215446]
MKPLVLQSIEDVTGHRCVDIIRLADGRFTFRECRRDPEDSHGWRYLSGAQTAIFDTAEAARAAALAEIGWMQTERDRGMEWTPSLTHTKQDLKLLRS